MMHPYIVHTLVHYLPVQYMEITSLRVTSYIVLKLSYVLCKGITSCTHGLGDAY